MGRQPILQDYGNIQNPPGDNSYQIEALHNMQRDKEFNAQMKLNDSGNKLRDYKDATKFIYDQNIDRTGINDLDIENANQLLSAKNEMVRMLKEDKATLQDVQLYGMRTLPKIDKAYTLGKNYKTQIDKGAVDMEKKYGNGFDISAYYNEAYKRLSNDLLDKDEKGEVIGYKDPSLIPKNRDYAAEIENDDASLGTVFKPSGAFEKGIQQTELIPIKGGTTRTDKYGKKVKQTYTGHGTIYDQPKLNENGEQVGWELKGEAVPLGIDKDGRVNMVTVMPKEQFEIATDTPAKRKDFSIKFNNYLNESGTNPSSLDERAKDILQREFAYSYFKKNNLHGSSFLPVDEIKEAKVSGSSGGSATKKNDTQDFVLRYKNAVEGHNTDKAVDIARELFAGNGKYTFDELKINKNDMGAVLSYKDDLGEIQYETLKLDDPNVYLKLAGLYQKITGSDSKLEKNIFEGKKDYSNKVKEEYTNVQSLIDSKGKTIQAGVKNGKWYDTKTGKPIE